MKELNNLELGKKYPGNYNREGLILEYNKGFTLYAFLPKITYDEALGFKTGKYKFALTEKDGILFFLSEFKGAISMSDAPFHMGLYSDDRAKDLPEAIEDNQGLALNVVVVDSATGIVKALRLIGLSYEFSVKLLEICRRQSNENVDKQEYALKLMQIQNEYEADDLYKLSITECGGR